jgi:hypothetical protein
MSMRCLGCIVIALAVSALSGQALFEGAAWFGEEQLKGKPRLVTVEREKLGENPFRLPEEESAYREDGKLSFCKRLVDGKLVTNEISDYDAQCHRTAITTRNGKDEVIRVQTFRRMADGAEEEIDVAGGKEQSRSIRSFDANQRVIELKSTDAGNVSTIMSFEYDDRGRPLEARIRLEGESLLPIEPRFKGGPRASATPANEQTMRLRIIFPGENQAIITLYDGTQNDKMLLQLETTADSAGNQMEQILFEQEPQGKPATSARVESVDAQGNWTLKTLLKRNPTTQVEEPVSRLHRSIVYY